HRQAGAAPAAPDLGAARRPRVHRPRAEPAVMRYRKLGRTGLDVSELGFGAWGIGGSMWIGADDDESLRALRRAIELGVNFLRTAYGYGDGHSEELVGSAVRESTETVYVAS